MKVTRKLRIGIDTPPLRSTVSELDCAGVFTFFHGYNPELLPGWTRSIVEVTVPVTIETEETLLPPAVATEETT